MKNYIISKVLVGRSISILVFLLLANCQSFCSDKPATQEKSDFFETKVRPLLAEHCYRCHGSKKQHSELRLDSRARILKGGERGPAMTVFQPGESRLISAVKREGKLAMPPPDEGEALSAEKISILSKWIADGAVWPESEADKAALATEKAARNFDQHWAFQAIANPDVPREFSAHSDWPRNDIDRFILQKLIEKKLTPSPWASPATLFRRIKWDLHGLPATAEETTAFKSESAATAIDELLASPHYGERWGRYWLDLARYADTKGYVFFVKPEFRVAWTYRDYVINSLNEDKPYDQFVREQLAADVLHARGEAKREDLAALGFLAVGAYFKHEIDDIMADRIDVVTRGLLGLTVGCARCHDHKYDPVSTKDYYSLYGVFRNSVEPVHFPFRVSQDQIPEKHRELADQIESAAAKLNAAYQDRYNAVMRDARERLEDYLLRAEAERAGPDTTAFNVIVDGDDLNPQLLLYWRYYLETTEKENDPVFMAWNQLAKIPGAEFAKRAPGVLATLAKGQSNPLVLEHLARAKLSDFSDVVKIYVALSEKIQTEVATSDEAVHEALRAVLSSPESPLQTPIHAFQVVRLFPDRPSQGVVKKLAAELDQLQAKAPPELAQMLTLEETDIQVEPRVFIRGNPSRPGERVSRRYPTYFNEVRDTPFAKGSGRLELAEAILSPQNTLTARVIVNRVWQHHFGRGLVDSPSNLGMQSPEPSHPELLDHLASWFVKNGSSLKSLHRYIMNSATWRQSSRARDNGLALDPENRMLWRMNRRRLDFETMRDNLLAVSGQLDLKTVGGPSVKDVTAKNNRRRTLYTHINRQGMPGVMRTFDFPPPDVSTGERNRTTVPGQALFLMNHPLVHDAARHLATEAASQKDPAGGVRYLFRKILARDPSPDELDETLAFQKSDATGNGAVPGIHREPSPWKYGGGRIEGDSNLIGFEPVTHWTGQRFQGSPAFPDSKRGYLFFDPSGGHPGNLEQVAVIRWVAPKLITVSVSGELSHSKPQGNGVRGRIFAAGKMVAGPWILHQKSEPTEIARIELRQGETLDFVVDIYEKLGWDSFAWSPTIAMTSDPGKSWNYTKEFRAESPRQITTWQSLAQTLLLTNEFQFVD